METDKAIEVLKSVVGEGKVIQTHASIVLITDEFAYKIKKPVDFGFLNYTQLRQRRGFSILEKELNSRYCDGIYLDVLKIIWLDNKYSLVPMDNTIPTVEYVLKMKRIPNEKFLSNMIDSIDTDTVRNYGSQIAKRLSTADKSASEIDGMNIYDAILYNCVENFTQINDLSKNITETLVDIRFEYIKKISERFLSDNKAMITKRYEEGFIKDGHGDLRLEHVYIDGGSVNLIDCIEFNTRFRTNDVVAEAAFLSMELDYNGRIELSDAFLRGFFDVYNDADSTKLLNFYRCYRAMVRAKVAILTMIAYPNDATEHADKFAEFNRMMDMALVYAMATENARPMVFCGFIGTGKSRLSSEFAKHFPLYRVNTDEVRKKLTGKELTDDCVIELDKGIYTPEKNNEVYAEIGNIVADLHKIGRISVIDGTFRKQEVIDIFEARLGKVRPLYIEVTAPDDVIKTRLTDREKRKTVSDGRLQHFDDMKQTSDALKADFMVSGEQTPAINISILIEFLINV